METTKIYSRDKLSQMMDQNKEEVNELMKIFVSMVPAMLQEMQDAVKGEDWSRCSDLAHKLKSSMRLWAIDSLDEDVLYIETNGLNAENTEQVAQKIQNLSRKLLGVIEDMNKELDIT